MSVASTVECPAGGWGGVTAQHVLVTESSASQVAEKRHTLPEREGPLSSVLILPFVNQHVENDLRCELFAELDSVLFHSQAET